MNGDLEGQGEIDTVFRLRVPPQPLDLINEANLMACGLAPTGDEGKTSKVWPATTITTVIPAN